MTIGNQLLFFQTIDGPKTAVGSIGVAVVADEDGIRLAQFNSIGDKLVDLSIVDGSQLAQTVGIHF